MHSHVKVYATLRDIIMEANFFFFLALLFTKAKPKK